MTIIKLFVGLKIPDTTAITAAQTLQRLSYDSLQKLTREDYYEFTAAGKHEEYKKKLPAVDILVNANKHYYSLEDKKEEHEVHVLVTDSDDAHEDLLSTLKHRLGFKHLESMKKGVLWKLHIEGGNPEETAKKITEELLYNKHYQSYEILK